MTVVHRNLVAHRINYEALAIRGTLAGLIAAAVMGLLTMLVHPLVEPTTDVWSFFKAVGSIVLGDDAATPLTGFEAAPVLLGMALHLAIGAVAGAVFALLIGLFDVEDTVPVMLMGLVYGVFVFLTSYLAIGQLLFPAFERLPLLVAFWSHVAFGILAGALLGKWHERFDMDRRRE